MTNKEMDVFGVLTWGLRKYAWLVVLAVLLIGGAIPAVLQQAPDRFEAEAQVGPTRQVRVPNVDVLPRVGKSIFNNVTKSDRVKEAAGVEADAVLPPDTVELVAGQDNLIFTVIGRSSDPERAKAIADTAAVVYSEKLNTYSEAVGSFAIGETADVPVQPMPKIAGLMAWGVGVLAGLCAGLGAVALLLVLRRPVIDIAGAKEATGAEVLGHVTLADRRGSAHGMSALCHRILSDAVELLLLVGPHKDVRQRHDLAAELSRWLSRVRRVMTVSIEGDAAELGSASLIPSARAKTPQLVIMEDASPVDVATAPDRSLTLLVVREGISQRALQQQAAQYLGGEGTAVVLVRKPRTSVFRIRRREHRLAPAPRLGSSRVSDRSQSNDPTSTGAASGNDHRGEHG